ncbi:Hypothetical protein PBC10988_40820 [Planctomycetales bacterium 10988]|nr:Hypothetical protein PBC10988_40820 [Planctomycetales bacterium 10988]
MVSRSFFVRLVVGIIGLCVIGSTPSLAELPQDSDWEANAILDASERFTISGIGAGQGVSIHDNHYYFYGDLFNASPRVGIIREYTRQFKPTGREILLQQEGKPIITHPTGLTWDNRWGCFLGDTFEGVATIYQIDWHQALEDGNLDRAIATVIKDDAAVNGCRPEFVTLGKKRFISTADYGDIRPEIRLYRPAKLLKEKRTSAPGVIAHRVNAGPFNQNLHWEESTSELYCVQNVIAGIGWQIDVINLQKAIADGRVDGEGVRVRKWTFNPHQELEGFRVLANRRWLLMTVYGEGNITMGQPQLVDPYISEAGNKQLLPLSLQEPIPATSN